MTYKQTLVFESAIRVLLPGPRFLTVELCPQIQFDLLFCYLFFAPELLRLVAPTKLTNGKLNKRWMNCMQVVLIRSHDAGRKQVF